MIRKYEASFEACRQCINDCSACLNAMMTEASGNDCPKCCRECVDICELSVRAMLRNSPYLEPIMVLCTEICNWCAEQCSEHDHDHCRRCAESCRKCAEECRRIAGIAV